MASSRRYIQRRATSYERRPSLLEQIVNLPMERQQSKTLQRRTSHSIFFTPEKIKVKDGILYRTLKFGWFEITPGNIIGIVGFLLAIVSYLFALLTPHWKEISAVTDDLNIPDVDVLVRTEAVRYFNTFYRSAHHSYGLLSRCDHSLHRKTTINDRLSIKMTCARNFLPLFSEERFDRCYGLEYYRFCSTKSEGIFDVNEVFSFVEIEKASTPSCFCEYPSYIRTCHVLGVSFTVLIVSCFILSILIPIFQTSAIRKKLKALVLLFCILGIILIVIHLFTFKNHLSDEPLDYFMNIEQHYRVERIYQLAVDTRACMNRFSSAIKISYGYSFFLAVLSCVFCLIGLVFTMKYGRIKSSTQTKIDDFAKRIQQSTSLADESAPIQTQKPVVNLIPSLKIVPDVDDQNSDSLTKRTNLKKQRSLDAGVHFEIPEKANN